MRTKQSALNDHRTLPRMQFASGGCILIAIDSTETVEEEIKLILTQHFPALLEKKWLNRIRFHDLRHNCARLLCANGVHEGNSGMA